MHATSCYTCCTKYLTCLPPLVQGCDLMVPHGRPAQRRIAYPPPPQVARGPCSRRCVRVYACITKNGFRVYLVSADGALCAGLSLCFCAVSQAGCTTYHGVAADLLTLPVPRDLQRNETLFEYGRHACRVQKVDRVATGDLSHPTCRRRAFLASPNRRMLLCCLEDWALHGRRPGAWFRRADAQNGGFDLLWLCRRPKLARRCTKAPQRAISYRGDVHPPTAKHQQRHRTNLIFFWRDGHSLHTCNDNNLKET